MSKTEKGQRGPLFYLIGVLALPLSVFAFIYYYNKSSIQDMYDNQYRYNVQTDHLYIYWTPSEAIPGDEKVKLSGKIAHFIQETIQENKKGTFKTKEFKDGVYIYSFVSKNADTLYESLDYLFKSFPELKGSLVRIEYDREKPPLVSEFHI